MTALPALIARLEKLTGPDREVDLLISRIGFKHQHIKWELAYLDTDGDDLPDGMLVWTTEREKPYLTSVARFTESMDAALTLVADGASFTVSNYCGAFVHSHKQPSHPGSPWHGEHRAPAIALTIAAFRAREQTQ